MVICSKVNDDQGQLLITAAREYLFVVSVKHVGDQLMLLVIYRGYSKLSAVGHNIDKSTSTIRMHQLHLPKTATVVLDSPKDSLESFFLVTLVNQSNDFLY